jgi:hypothetical protein
MSEGTMSEGTRYFFVLLPSILLPTLFFLAWLLPALWNRLRHGAKRDGTESARDPEPGTRSESHTRRA